MGLYSDIPGRDPAAEAKAAWKTVVALVRQFHEVPASAERAEFALQAIVPLVEEFFDHAELLAWRKETEAALLDAYARAGLPAPKLPDDALPGLHEARQELSSAGDAMSLSRAEAAFKHVLHHAPQSAAAAAGLKQVEEKQRALRSSAGAAIDKRQRFLAARRALPAEEKLLAMANLCHGEELAPCKVCRFLEHTSEPVTQVRGLHGIVGATVERVIASCGYRRDIAEPLIGREPPQAGRVMSAWRELPADRRAALAPAVAQLYERFLREEATPD